MGLFDAGKLDLSIPALFRLAKQVKREMEGNLPVFEMRINDLVSYAPDHPDNVFDRVANARSNSETFWQGGREYRVTFCGAGKVHCEAVKEDTSIMPRPDKLYLTEQEVFNRLTSQNGETANPYVAMIEMTYSKLGYRAGYGIRRDGRAECFYS